MKYMLLIVVFSGFIVQSNAQKSVSFIASYPISFPMGNTSDYVGKTSFRGISFEVNLVQDEHVEYGLETSWHVFYGEESSKVYTDGTVSIKGAQFRYINSVPLLAQGRWFFREEKSDKKFTPFAGAGIGTIYVNQATDFGLYRITKEAWQFALRPEIGLLFKNSNSVPGGFVSVRYYAGFDTDDLDAQSYLSLNIGIRFN